MKSCNNCNTINELQAEKCAYCKMPNNFTFHDEPNAGSPGMRTPPLQCINCGTFSPGDGEQCVDCRFPLPAARCAGELTRLPVPLNRKRTE